MDKTYIYIEKEKKNERRKYERDSGYKYDD